MEPLAPPAKSLRQLGEQAAACQACPLWRNATQTVFGEGSAHATLMLVGEQPGDREDIEGHPFVGPAGGVLDRALAAAGIDRSRCYVTNAVKHFKNVPRGKRRLHQRPDVAEIEICRWWLFEERRLIAPKLTVAMGATAARSLFGRAVTIGKLRGRIVEDREGRAATVTVHPSYVLRQQDDATRDAAFERLVRDLGAVRGWLEKPGAA